MTHVTRASGAVIGERAATFVGRDAERAFLLRLVADDGPVVAFVHGPAGIGKSSLLAVFAAEADARVITVHGEAFEPTEAGFLRALDADAHSLADALDRLCEHEERVVIAIDGYERLLLLDDWLRRVLVPALPAHARVAVFGRDAPGAAWVRAFGPSLAVRELDSLPAREAAALLARLGVPPDRVAPLNRVLRGHPLSLRLAAATGDAPAVPALDELARSYLRALPESTRAALDAACVVRRVTDRLMAAMLDDEDALERLRVLPFVSAAGDGLVVHDVLREAVAAELAATDRPRHRRLRAAAWRQLRTELATAENDPWPSAAEMLYLLDGAAVRDAFFPVGAPLYSVEPAVADDGPMIAAIAERHEPPAGAALLRTWWELVPDAFSVARDAMGDVAGFSAVCERTDLPAPLFDRDPVAAVWRADLRAHPLARDERALFVRFMCGARGGERPTPDVISLFQDLMRSYLALRPALRRVYTCAHDPALAASAEPLGFSPLDAEPRLDGVPYRCLCNDFGPGSVDGWLTRLAARDVLAGSAPRLDPDRRRLVLDGRPVELTPAEFGVLWMLYQHNGNVVRRAALADEVCGAGWDGDGNPLDAAIKGVRRKLGAHASALETVRGIGYRLRPTGRPSP